MAYSASLEPLSRDTLTDRKLLLLCGCLFAVYVCVGYGSRALVSDPHWLDTDGWLDTAKTLCLNGEFGVEAGEPSLRRAPIYPLGISVFCIVADVPIETTVPIINALGYLILLLSVGWHSLFRFSPHRLLIVALVGLDPLMLVWSGRTYVEPLLIGAIAAVILAFDRFMAERTVRGAILLAVAWATSLLIKPILIYLPLLWLVVLLVSGSTLGQLAKWLVAFALASLLVVSPWLIRNYALSGEVMLQEGGVSQVLKGDVFARLARQGIFSGQEERALAELHNLDIKLGIQGASVVEQERHYAKHYVQSVLEKPSDLALKLTTQSATFWVLGGSAAQTMLYTLLVLPVLAFALWAVFGVIGWRDERLIGIILMIGYMVAVHAVSLAIARYSMPVRPWVVALACVAAAPVIAQLLRRIRGRSSVES